MTNLHTKDDFTVTDRQYTSTECIAPLYDLTTQGSHPLVICQPCRPNGEDLLSKNPAYATTHATPQATTQATIHVSAPATTPATTQTVTQATSPASSIPTIVSEPNSIPQSTSDKKISNCPNRVIDFDHLKKTVDAHLGFCKICKREPLQ